MAIDSPQVNDTRCMFGDWIELLALASTRGTASRADIARLISMQADTEHGVEADPDTGEELEAEILDSRGSELADNVADELDFRAHTLGTSYPFRLNVRSETWSIEVDPTALERPGARIYVFCLLISTLRDGRLAGSAIAADAAEDFTRLFQHVSFLAAVQLMGNGGQSFGWPRPDGSKFLEAIQQFTRAFGIGEAKSQFHPSSMHKEKDEGIDVIAWRSFADGRAGKILLYGQVASGNDWTDKPVEAAVSRFMDWFVTHPSKFHLPAIFIPFVQHHKFEPIKAQGYEVAVQDYCRRQEISFGLVVDRLRIVEVIAAGETALLNEPLRPIDTWNDVALQHARRAA